MPADSVGMPLDRDRVELRASDPAWSLAYERERRALQEVLAPLGPTWVEHIGSTAISGIQAKPIIDIMVGVRSYARFDEQRACLESLGYFYDPHAERDDPGRRVFRKNRDDAPSIRTHHLHLTLVESTYWVRILGFRDYLRANPEVAREYERLKAQLVDDPASYTRMKAPFVRRVEELATVTP